MKHLPSPASPWLEQAHTEKAEVVRKREHQKKRNGGYTLTYHSWKKPKRLKNTIYTNRITGPHVSKGKKKKYSEGCAMLPERAERNIS